MELTVNHMSKDEATLARIFIVARLKIKTFTKGEASKWVGGRRRLEQLVAEKKIRQTKTSEAQAARWMCNAEDVLRHAVIPRRILNI